MAKMCNVSPAAITKAYKQGRIVVMGTGAHARIDVCDPKNMAYINIDEKDRMKGRPPVDPNKPKKKKRKKRKARKKNNDLPATPENTYIPQEKPLPPEYYRQISPNIDNDNTPIEGIKSLDDIDETNLFLLSKQDIDKLKSYEQAMTAKMKREEARGLLVPKKLVKNVFDKLYAIDNNELRAIEDRVAPGLCEIFGVNDESEEVTKACQLLNKEITKSLKHIKRKLNDFLLTLGESI